VHIVVPLQVRVASLVRIADRAIEKGGDLWQAPPHNRGCPQARPGLQSRGKVEACIRFVSAPGYLPQPNVLGQAMSGTRARYRV